MCLLFFIVVLVALPACVSLNTSLTASTEPSTVTPTETQTEIEIETPKPPETPISSSPAPSADTTGIASVPIVTSLEKTLIDRYAASMPTKWGENILGVRTHFVTKERVMALTFDACGGKEGSGYDVKLIDYLIKENIPATLFINARWIAANPATFAILASNPLFEIENHGTDHRPLSVVGKPAYGIAGTKNVADVIREVKDNADQIEKLTGRRPLFFRSGTAFYDEVAVSVVHDLGFDIAGYNVLGDAGATYNTEQVYKALLKAPNGAIVLAHMNHPEKDTAEGVIKAIPELRKAGFSFVQLASVALP